MLHTSILILFIYLFIAVSDFHIILKQLHIKFDTYDFPIRIDFSFFLSVMYDICLFTLFQHRTHGTSKSTQLNFNTFVVPERQPHIIQLTAQVICTILI